MIMFVLAIAGVLILIGIGLMWYVNTKPTLDEIIQDKKAFDLGQWSEPNE